jgi:CheY-like chemotaxis protein
MTYRTEQRTPLRLTALVWGSDEAGHMFMETVQTLDISPLGARLRKLQHPVHVGHILGIQNGDKQGRFEVVWVGEDGTEREGQFGVRCIQIGRESKKSILYIDDQDFELDRRRGLLEAFGYTVYTAATAQEAFDLLNVVQVDAVMLDQPFPGVNDVTFVDQIKRTKPDAKVLVVTAFPSQVVERVLEMTDACIHKGENQNKLIAEMEKLIGPGHTLKWPITRTLQRYKVVVPVIVRVTRSGVSVHLNALSTDMSEGGIGVELRTGELTAGEIISVEFSLPTSPHPMKLYGMVRHRKMNQYGIQFVDISGEHRQAIGDLCDVLVPMDLPH